MKKQIGLGIAISMIVFSNIGTALAETWNILISPHTFIVNGEVVNANALNINGSNYVGVAEFAEFLDIDVSFDENTGTVSFDKSQSFVGVRAVNIQASSINATEQINSKDNFSDNSNVEANSENVLNTIKHLTTKPRVTGSEFEKELSVFYANIFESYGYEVELQEFPFKTLTKEEMLSINQSNALDFNYTAFDGTGTNIIAKKSTSSKDNKDILVISAHYDSGSVNNGVFDNATGVAAVMELASMLKDVPLDKEIRFILFSGEENFMYGSRYYVGKLDKSELENITNINIDSIGEEGEINPILGTIDGEPNGCTQLFDEFINRKSIEIKKGPPSDYLAFEYAGRPAITIAQYPSRLLSNIEGLISGDRIERVDVQKIKDVVDMLYSMIIN